MSHLRPSRQLVTGAKSLAPDRYERVLAWSCVALTLVVATAVARGEGEWHRVGATVWAHLGLAMVAVVITPVMLLRRRGDRLHRALGWVWALCMFATALVSLNVRDVNRGAFSGIHILSVLVIIAVPMLVYAARRHRVASHRRSARALITGVLLIAGFFTFPFNRLLGHWLFG